MAARKKVVVPFYQDKDDIMFKEWLFENHRIRREDTDSEFYRNCGATAGESIDTCKECRSQWLELKE